MNKKFYKTLCLMLVLALALTGCFGGQNSTEAPKESTGDTPKAEEKAEPKILRINNSSEPGSLHPGKAQGTHDSWVIEHVMEGLMKNTPNGVEKGLAKDIQVSEDGLTYTITIRDDAKWTNGDPVTAGDFEVAWKYLLDPATASEYSYQLYYLKGAEEYNTGKEGATADGVGVKAKDDKTLVVELAKPTPFFTDLLAFYTYLPVNKNVQQSNPNWANEADTYVSNGAFKLVEWKHKESIKVVKNPDYYDAANVKLDEIHFAMIDDENTAWQLYKAGDLDLGYPLPQDVVAQLSAANDPEFVIGNDFATYYYRFNTTKKPFNNVKVRKALAMAIDRESIVKNVTQGGQQPAFSYTPPGIFDVDGKDFNANVGPQFTEDVEAAKKLLAEGLKEEGLSAFPQTVLLYNTSEGHKRIAEAIQEMWRKNLGVEVTLENVEFQVKIDREDKLDYDISRAGWIGDYLDPMTFLDMYTSASQQNDTGWTSKEYDQLINEAQNTSDLAVRSEKFKAAEKMLGEEMPVMPIYFYTAPYTLKPYVTGVYKPANRYPQFHYADLNK